MRLKRRACVCRRAAGEPEDIGGRGYDRRVRTVLLEVRETLSRADHQTHRRFGFEVPSAVVELWIEVSYSPKRVVGEDALELIVAAVRRQALAYGEVVGPDSIDGWVRHVTGGVGSVRDLTHGKGWVWGAAAATQKASVANLITVSVDDPHGRYRGAGHRHDASQRLVLAERESSAGFVAGPLIAGQWILTVSAHTVVSDQVELSIRIGAEMASSLPSGLRSSA